MNKREKKKLKRAIYIFIIVLSLIVAAVVSAPSVILRIAQRQLSEIFVDGKVSIKGARFLPLRRISLLDVRVARDGVYDFQIAQVNINYSLSSLLRKTIFKVTLNGPDIKITLPKKDITELAPYVRLGPPGSFLIETLALQDLNVNVRLKEISLEAKASAEWALENLSMRSIDLVIASLQVRKFLLEEGILRMNRRSGANELHIRNIQYDKANVERLNGLVRLEEQVFFLDAFSAQGFNGLVKGSATLKIGEDPEYLVNLECTDLSLERFVEAFELEEKIQMSGLVSGWVVLSGRGTEVEVLDGDFSMASTGGMFVVKDTRTLEDIARASGQSLDLLMENFRNYHYNRGAVTMSLEKKALSVDMALEGEAGKRNLNIVLHDFQLTREKKDKQ